MLLAGSFSPQLVSSAIEGSRRESFAVSAGLDQEAGDFIASVDLEVGSAEPPLIRDDQARCKWCFPAASAALASAECE